MTHIVITWNKVTVQTELVLNPYRATMTACMPDYRSLRHHTAVRVDIHRYTLNYKTSSGIYYTVVYIHIWYRYIYTVMNNNTQVIYSLIWAQVCTVCTYVCMYVLYTSYTIISESTYCMYNDGPWVPHNNIYRSIE